MLALDIGTDALNYTPVRPTKSAPDPRDVEDAAKIADGGDVSGDPRRSGRAVRRGIDELVQLAELLQAPVMTTVDGKSAFPEDHALALGSGGNTFTGQGAHFLYTKADLILGDRHRIEPSSADHAAAAEERARSFTPPTTRAICTRATHTEVALLGDAKLTLAALDRRR